MRQDEAIFRDSILGWWFWSRNSWKTAGPSKSANNFAEKREPLTLSDPQQLLNNYCKPSQKSPILLTRMSVVTDLGIREDNNVITHEEVLAAANAAEPLLTLIFSALVKEIAA